ncbi:MAG: oligosaccharide repeat unit polymerase [Bacteroidales bacterium]|nr:oligosaccharide repeat unit polymerase [Bacteroidales bacterium]
MRIIYGLTLGSFYFIIFVRSYKISKDIFSPLCFFSFMQFIAYVPGIMFFENHMGIELDEINTFFVFVAQILVAFFTWLGIRICKCLTNHNSHCTIEQKNVKSITFIGLVLYMLGLFSTIYFIVSVGGVHYIITHPQLNYARGNSYLMSLQNLMVIGILCLFGSNKKPSNLAIFITFGIYVLTIVIFTKRAPIIHALLLILMAYNYRVRNIKPTDFFKPTVLFLVFLSILLIVSLPMLRNPLAFGVDVSFWDIFVEGIHRIDKVFEEYSFTSRDAFVYTNYHLDNMYYGRTLINFLTAPLPSSVFPWKPPVDDGIYLANFVAGYYILPPANVYPIHNSFPFSSQGSMYANFGIIGLVIGAVILGIIYEYFYMLLKDTEYNIFTIFVYHTIINTLALSSKNITQTIIPIGLLIISFKIFTGIKLKKRRTKIELGGNY